ncbi:LAMI_0H00826g1_1 [Lachancea mirantina]|uniref:LAMI_0H00826g1_1 n=1 Tax=Lachancea mirantina TaxID=1230905 RepID=A0A1G4KDM8_9SACH|nr:LAMI_0H00826g1_1 [Lachancea mirantina]
MAKLGNARDEYRKEPLICTADHCFSVEVKQQGSKTVALTLKTSSLLSGNDKVLLKTDPQATRNIFGDAEVIVLDSVKSGTGRSENADFANIVVAPVLQDLKVDFKVVKTDSTDAIKNLAKGLSPSKDYFIMMLSGDTSISEFFNGLPDDCKSKRAHKITLVPFPMGTGNAWASSLGFTSPIALFRSMLAGQLTSRKFPLYRAVFPNDTQLVFFIILSAAFHANLLHLCAHPKYQKMGVERFRVASEKLLNDEALSCQICIPKVTEGSFNYFAVINTSNLERTYKPSPCSDVLKSELHLLAYSSSLCTEELVARIMKGYQNKAGDDINDNGVLYQRMLDDFEVHIDSDPANSPRSKFDICCDGHLLNLLDLQKDGKPFNNKIDIKFLKNYSSFELELLAP